MFKQFAKTKLCGIRQSIIGDVHKTCFLFTSYIRKAYCAVQNSSFTISPYRCQTSVSKFCQKSCVLFWENWDWHEILVINFLLTYRICRSLNGAPVLCLNFENCPSKEILKTILAEKYVNICFQLNSFWNYCFIPAERGGHKVFRFS